MSYNVADDDPTYNPFAEDERFRSLTPAGRYSSAFFPSSTLRRRQSPSLNEQGFLHEGHPKRHTRAHTEIQIVSPNSAGLHPLKSALAAATFDAVLPETVIHVTRPNLSRIVGGANTLDVPSDKDRKLTKKPPDMADQERDVIVHQVTSKDSLAGVAVKYGITLANLRRANQLWTSDSIHRRSVLYIPIDQASRACEYFQERQLVDLTPDATRDATNTFEDSDASTSAVNSHNGEAVPSQLSVPVVRVPVKQLTYFPPSSNKNSDMGSNRQSFDHLSSTPLIGPRISPTPSKYDPTLPNNSLTSILTALPIAASTRDEIITRLSFDNVSSSTTDRSRANSVEENSHELGEVGKPNRPKGLDELLLVRDDTDEMMPTQKMLGQNNPRRPYGTSTRPVSNTPSSLPKSYIHSISSNSPPHFYVLQSHETHVRTSQLEPSPAMEIPIRHSNTDRSTSGRSLNAGGIIGFERTPSLRTNKTSSKDIDLHSLAQKMHLSEHR